MKYRTRKEIARLSLAEVLAELDTSKLEPEGQVVFLTDGLPDRQQCPTAGDPPHFLTEAQKQECQELGRTTLTLQQQAEQGTTLELWCQQLYQHGVTAYVQSLGMAKAQRELKARHAELTTWEARRVTRQEVEKKLIQVIENEQEQEEVTA